MHRLRPLPEDPKEASPTIGTMDLDQPLRESVVAGYRVLRTLARGERARVLLGFDPPAPGRDGPGSTVALKVLPDAKAVDVAVEVEALTRAAGDHVVRLIDVSLDESSACLVLERLERGTLSDLMLRRTALEPGEVVTIVAPLAITVGRLHDAGVAHASISPSTIGFSASGAPVLTGFGSAELFPAGSPEVVRERVPGVLADRRAIAELAIALFRRTGDASVVESAERELAGDSAELLGRLTDLLFGSAAAMTVRFEAVSDPAPSLDRRIVPTVDPDGAVLGSEGGIPPGPPSRSGLTWLAGVLPDSMRERLARIADDPSVRGFRERWRAAPPKRRRIVVAAGAIGVTLAIALALPTGGQPGAIDPPVDPVPATEGADDPEADDPEADDPVVGDDPVAALRALWARRLDCVRERSILCLDGVDQDGSAALDLDRALVSAVDDGVETPLDLGPDADLVLVERLGDSALIDLPDRIDVDAVLLIRDAEGWRIRDYLRGPATETPAPG